MAVELKETIDKRREEIFLGILTREYLKWNESLKGIIDSGKKLDVDGFSKAIARSMEDRKTLLKISAMNLYEIEDNSRVELLIEAMNEVKLSYSKTSIYELTYRFLKLVLS